MLSRSFQRSWGGGGFVGCCRAEDRSCSSILSTAPPNPPTWITQSLIYYKINAALKLGLALPSSFFAPLSTLSLPCGWILCSVFLLTSQVFNSFPLSSLLRFHLCLIPGKPNTTLSIIQLLPVFHHFAGHLIENLVYPIVSDVSS